MISRRGLILSGAAIGGGLAIGYASWRFDDGNASEKFAAAGRPGAPLNAWIKIDPAGAVTFAIHRAEMGQGVTTSLSMLLAEELDADWDRVGFEFAPVDRDYYNFGMLLGGQPLGDPAASWFAGAGTGVIRQVFHAIGLSMTISSSSTIDAWDSLRQAGAAARQMLIAAAARRWDADPAALQTDEGRVIDSRSGRVATYGELADAASHETPPSNPPLKDPARFRIVGQNVPRLDGRMKVTGEAIFGIDVIRPGMLFATVIHSPVAGSRVAGFEANGADGMPGVRRIALAGKPGQERAVGIVADDTWQAMQAAKRVRVAAETPARRFDSPGWADRYLQTLDADDLVIFRDDGAAAAMLDQGAKRVTAEYAVPFLAHACLEPMNCTALCTGAELEIWAPTQAHSVARDIGAEIAGIDPRNVTVHTTFMGGGFGRRAEMDFVEQAVSLACQLPGQTIKLTWSREQDLRHDAYRPAAACRISGSIDGTGRILAIDYRLATQSVVASYETRTPTPRGGDSESDASVVTAVDPPPYRVDNLRVSYAPVDSHVPAGFWRSVSHSWNSFFLESFIDELAHAAGIDPLTFRRRALADRPRALRVLDAVATGAAGSGADGVGYAVTESHGTVVAHAIGVTRNRGEFGSVASVICAVDCGPVVHPDTVVAQIEGSVVDGLSAALYGNIDIREGRVSQGNFDTYRRLRLTDTPRIDVIIMDSEKRRPGGIGEPGVPGVAPALANAIFAATGSRPRRLPIVAQRRA